MKTEESFRQLSGRRVLVTGASGFLGWHLCKALVSRGADVRGLARGADDSNVPERCTPIARDLTHLEDVREVVEQFKPQVVFHLAGRVTARQEPALVLPTFQDCLTTTVNLLTCLHSSGCQRVVLAASSEQAPGELGVPASPYAVAKACASMYAEMFSKVFELPTIRARLFVAYGPRQSAAKVIPYIFHQLQKGDTPVLSSPDRICDFVYVDDAVDALVRCAWVPDIEALSIDVGTGVGTRIGDLPGLVGRMTSRDPGALEDRELARRFENSQIADLERTQRLLGWSPSVDLKAGLEKTIESYSQPTGSTNDSC